MLRFEPIDWTTLTFFFNPKTAHICADRFSASSGTIANFSSGRCRGFTFVSTCWRSNKCWQWRSRRKPKYEFRRSRLATTIGCFEEGLDKSPVIVIFRHWKAAHLTKESLLCSGKETLSYVIAVLCSRSILYLIYCTSLLNLRAQ